MHAGQPERAAAASRAWNNELTAMQVAWKKNPTRALRFSDYDSAMRTLYGRSTAGHDDSSYVVSRMGREHNLTRLRAFQPYNEHPEATIPLSPNGITHAHTIPLMVLCSPRAIMHSPRAFASVSGVCARAHSARGNVPRSSESLHARAAGTDTSPDENIIVTMDIKNSTLEAFSSNVRFWIRRSLLSAPHRVLRVRIQEATSFQPKEFSEFVIPLKPYRDSIHDYLTLLSESDGELPRLDARDKSAQTANLKIDWNTIANGRNFGEAFASLTHRVRLLRAVFELLDVPPEQVDADGNCNATYRPEHSDEVLARSSFLYFNVR